jgi:transcriptional regulator GlxA family with amidase domain
MNVSILVFDRFTDLDVFLPWDLLKRVNEFFPQLDWNVQLVGTAAHHTSFAGLTIPMTHDLEALRTSDAVLVTSGPGVQTLIRDKAYLQKLQTLLDPERQLIGSMCSGAILLAAAGILKNNTRATTYATRMKQLESYDVEVIDEPLVTDCNLATAAGCLSAIHLSRWMIERLLPAETAEQVARKVIASVQPNGQPLPL